MTYRPSMPGQSHPVRHSGDKRRRPDGTGPARKGWGEIGTKYVYQTHLGRFVAKVRVAGKLVYLGTWGSEAEAAEAVGRKLGEACP